jgi:cobalt-zinc-cadmium efflux system protein
MEAHGHHHHGHAQSHSLSATDAYNKAFLIGIGLNALYVVAEVAAGLYYDSVALLTDAGHNASDVASLLLSLLAFRLARKKASDAYTYGYKKTTILAALTNAVILLVAIGVLGYESIDRLRHPEAVQGRVIAGVAGIGIVINALSAWLFYRGKEADLNIRSAYLHLLADALVSVGVVAGGVAISYTGWYWLDPVIGLVIMLVILVSTWSLLRDSFRMAVDAVPAGLSVQEVTGIILGVDKVEDVHHVHIWALSTTENALTAHIVVAESLTFEEKLDVVRRVKHELLHHHIHHSTIELESVGHKVSCGEEQEHGHG